MKPRTTHWLVGLALVLLFVIVLTERGAGRRREAAAAALLLPRFDPATATSLQFRQGTNEPLVLERATNAWFFRAPFPYPAQPESVGRFLVRLAGLRERGRIGGEEVARQTNGLAAFGLAPPAATITIGRGEERVVVNLGNATAIGREVYAQVVGRDAVITLEAAVLEWLPPGADAWRDRALVNLASVPFDRLQVRPLTNGFEVVRHPTDRTWQMTKPWPTRANSARLEFLLQELGLLRVASFVQDEPGAEDLTAYGLQPPQRELSFGQGTNDVLTLQVGLVAPGDTNRVYVRPLHRGNVVLVERPPLAPWLEVSREAYLGFCDRRLLVFELEAVDRIVIQADEAFTVQRLTNGTWRIMAPFTAPADPVLVIEALAEMAGLEFLALEREVVTDFSAYGLAPPRRRYRLERATVREAGATNGVVAEVSFGNPSGHRYFVRRSLEDSVVLALNPVRLPKAAYQLRQRQLWNISTNDVAAITVSQGQQARRVVRTGPMQWALADGPGGPPNGVTLEEAAYLLGQLRAERWVAVGDDALPRYGFLDGGHQVTLEAKPGLDPPQLTVRFGSTSPAGRMYAAVTLASQPGPVIFECPARLREFVLNDLSLPRAAPGPAP